MDAVMSSSRPCLQMPKCRGVDIEELSITQLQTHLENQNFTSKDLTQTYLERIESLNPRIKAVIEKNPDALDIAEELDRERRNGTIRSKIHGIPFLVKDNLATKDKMKTTAGSAALVNSQVPEDASVVRLLRAAGGVLLGKTNLSEWASMRATYYAEGYTSRGGQNRNPYNLAEHAGGSSSGSASAVAANMCVFSIGTETDGSVMFPADRNAVVGIKPTVGFTSMSGVIPEAPSMDTVGPFGRSVEDAVIVLDIITGVTSHDVQGDSDHPTIVSSNHDGHAYFKQLAKRNILRGAKFGLPQTRVWERVRRNEKHLLGHQRLYEFIERLQEAGATILETNFPSAEEIIPVQGWDWSYAEGRSGSKLSELEVVNIEFYRSLREYLGKLENNKDGMLSLEDIVAYNVEHTETEGGVPGTNPAWPTGQDGFDNCIKAQSNNEEDYHRALKYIRRKSREEGIDAALKYADGEIDALLVPLQADGGVACSVAAKAGYPMISVPVGVDEKGVPFGIGLMQTGGRDDVLVRYASAIEDLIGPRMRPSFQNFDADNYPMVGNQPFNPSHS